MDKDQTLEYYASKDVDFLDTARDKKILELRDVLSKLYKAKDELLVTKHEKRKQLLQDGNSFSKTEQILRGDDELYTMTRMVMGHSSVRDKVKLELEIITGFFWKAKN